MITHVYCNCNNQQPEEIKRGVYTCLNCHNDVNPADFAQDEPDFSEAPDLIDVDAMNKGYEDTRFEEASEERSYVW